jgi:hypothetical protein
MSGIALWKNDDLEEQSWGEKYIIEAFCQFNYKTVEEENTDCEKEQCLSAVS